MKENRFLSKARTSHQLNAVVKGKTILLTALLSMAFSFANAALVTHEWQKDHLGYSIELVPGTGEGGVPAEYVAAGSVHDFSQPLAAWHFMHLDDNGNVIAERTSWAKTGYDHEFRVVDITCQSNDEFWITIQARNRTSGSEKDYIYLAGVDLSGNDLSVNPAIAISSNYPTHNNLYPTHSYFADNGYLYLCGYAANGTEFPNEPNKYHSDKYGMFMRVDVVNKTTSYYFWDGGNINGHDYDMALRIAPYGYGTTFPLLVTGAVTTPDEKASAVLVAKFYASGLPQAITSLQTVTMGQEEPKEHGFYGIDIRGGIYGGQNGFVTNPDIIVLVNEFDEKTPNDGKYGIMRIKNDLTHYPSPTLSYRGMSNSSGKSWAKQFQNLHSRGTTSNANQDIVVIGEQTKYYTNTTTPAGNLPPSNISVNAFTSYQPVGNGHWDFVTGFIPNSQFNIHEIYLSSMGTNALNMDYLNGSMGVNALLEDESRLHTFATNGGYYNDPTVSPQPHAAIAMVLPIGNEVTGSPYLKTKYLRLDLNRNEPTCQQQNVDAHAFAYAELFSPTLFSSMILYENVVAVDGYSLFSITSLYNNIPSVTDCTSGYYKPTGVAGVDANKTINLYPNPTITELNINFGSEVSGSYNFKLMDITGKVVYQQSGVVGKVQVQLPQLSAGTYLATVSTNEVIHSEQLVIQ